ncbi:MAG TPA: Ig-like domain-containing protein [Candidatus Saccharimonadales bacterium]|nr:Ig-like domain-containing protein [Candidatus Saccharimonadales bacterium]
MNRQPDTCLRWRWIGIFALLAMIASSLQAQTLWTGPGVQITHTTGQAANPTVPANTDQITPHVWITRASSLGIFNAFSQTSYGDQASPGSGTPDGSPSDTEWAIGSLDNYASLAYGSWFSVLHGSQGVGMPAVLHLISDDIYLSINFSSFANDGSCTYVRSTAAAAAPTVAITNPASGTVLAAPATVTLSASASVIGGTVTNVTFFTNSVAAGSTATLPFRLTITTLPAGSYALTAAATAAGISTTSSVVSMNVVAPVAIFITAPAISGGHFLFDHTANVGLSYVVERSSNLVRWLPVSTNSASNSPAIFIDGASLAAPQFYRVIRPPNP